MAFTLARWRPRHLFLAWTAYWLILLVSVARLPLTAALRAISGPEGHGTMSATFDNDVLRFVVKSDSMSYDGSASFTSIALWLVGPPLVLWLLWFVTRPRPVAARERVL